MTIIKNRKRKGNSFGSQSREAYDPFSLSSKDDHGSFPQFHV